MANTFRLSIVSLDGVAFTGDVQSVSCRAIDGDVAILANHTNYVTAVGMGTAVVRMADGTVRSASCIGGLLSMIDNQCSLIVTTWEWQEDIDVERAHAAKKEAESVLESTGLTDQQYNMARAKLQRALVRINTAG